MKSFFLVVTQFLYLFANFSDFDILGCWFSRLFVDAPLFGG